MLTFRADPSVEKKKLDETHIEPIDLMTASFCSIASIPGKPHRTYEMLVAVRSKITTP